MSPRVLTAPVDESFAIEPVRTRLVILRGLPASGKTTWAHAWVAEDRVSRARVNRDELRLMLHGPERFYSPETEVSVKQARNGIIHGMLATGVSVVVDETNLRESDVEDLAMIGTSYDARVEIEVMAASVEECIARDAVRQDGLRVGLERILEMNQLWRFG